MGQKILFVLSKSEPGCIAPVKKAIASSEGLELLDVGNIAEATTVAQAGFNGLAVLFISTKEDLVGVISMMKAIAPFVLRQKTIRVVVFNQLDNDKVAGALASLGCAEVLGFDVTAKAFLFKIQRHLKLIRPAASPAGTKINSALARTDETSSDDEETGPKTTIKSTDALTIAEDYWLFRTHSDAKRIMGKWLVEIIGPGPSVGEWVPIPTKFKERGASTFEWRVREKEGPFATPNGRWILVCRQSEFVWRINRWRFVGDKVSLTFQRDEKIVARRFFSDGTDVMYVADNSEAAKAKRDEIEASFSGEKRVEADHPNSSGHKKDMDQMLYPPEEETDSDFAIKRPKKKAGRELEIELDPHNRGKELSIALDPKDELDQLDKMFDEPGDAPYGGEIGDDPSSPAFNDHGARRQNIFNSGRGLTQGQKSDRALYADDEFDTGVEAFKPVGLKSTLQGRVAEVQQSDERKLTIRVQEGEFQCGDSVHFIVDTVNLRPAGSLSAHCKIVEFERVGDSSDIRIEVELDEQTAETWTQIQYAVTSRQMSILKFLKMAKGA